MISESELEVLSSNLNSVNSLSFKLNISRVGSYLLKESFEPIYEEEY
jgi:hypothetical protein